MISFNYPRILPLGENASKRKTLRLYMYVTAEALFSILKSGRLKLSHPWKTNDITECLAQNESQLRHEIKNFGYLCFTSDCTSPAMWGYYADKGKGACLVFDFDVIEVSNGVFELVIDSALNVFRPTYIRKVTYGENRCENNSCGNEFFHKSQEWAHEQEYRMVLELENEDIEVETVSVGHSIMLAHYFPDLLAYMCGVILGPQFVGEGAEIKSFLKHTFPQRNKEYICENNFFKISHEIINSARNAEVHRAVLNRLRFHFDIPPFISISHAEILRNFRETSALSFVEHVGCSHSIDLERIYYLYTGEKPTKHFASFLIKIKNGESEQYYLTAINEEKILIREEKKKYYIELDYPALCLDNIYSIFLKSYPDTNKK